MNREVRADRGEIAVERGRVRAVGVEAADGQDVAHDLWVVVMEVELVARGDRHDHAAVVGIGHGAPQLGVERDGAQAHADHRSAAVGGVDDRLGEPSPVVQDVVGAAHRQDARARSDAGDPDAVVGGRAQDTGDVGAVARSRCPTWRRCRERTCPIRASRPT
jgi:hypothetical protein